MDEVKAAFMSFDTNNDGLISSQEYIDGCRNTGNKTSVETLQKAFDLFDLNHDRFMDIKEFYCAMNYLSATE